MASAVGARPDSPYAFKTAVLFTAETQSTLSYAEELIAWTCGSLHHSLAAPSSAPLGVLRVSAVRKTA